MSIDLLRPIRVTDAAGQALLIEQAIKAQDFPGVNTLLFADESGEDPVLRLQAKFTRTREDKQSLSLQIDGTIFVSCQRCLGKMNIDVKHSNNYVLVATDKDAEKFVETDEEILVLANQESQLNIREGELDLGALLAEELQLAIPFYPRHEHAEECVESGWEKYSADTQSVEATFEEEKQRPFAGLKDLIKH
ncbi:MAG: DUF177 domain-containing protein [Gammaproteobacteria bacterium]|nr:DUF177 domain-containing protein [Gammaproteobacteria bacterium]